MLALFQQLPAGQSLLILMDLFDRYTHGYNCPKAEVIKLCIEQCVTRGDFSAHPCNLLLPEGIGHLAYFTKFLL